jgi:hypothetical protein
LRKSANEGICGAAPCNWPSFEDIAGYKLPEHPEIVDELPVRQAALRFPRLASSSLILQPMADKISMTVPIRVN